ncbi:MAG TPA: DUF488 domain-containing protein [Ignavibacteria bacterium]|nr:DUF488 domain-containing protein [Ignavibacteria bacterium]
MINVYTIGFTKKSAEKFFELLKIHGVKKIIDTRLKNETQLSGFAKGKDLKYFAKIILNIDYIHRLDMAPTQDILENYRNKIITWEKYSVEYLNLLNERDLGKKINPEELNDSCLLCSEEKPDNCHRRLLAEYIKEYFHNTNINIEHII